MTDEKIVSEFRRVMREEARAVEKAAEYVDEENILRVVKLLAECRGRAVVAGCGTSGVAAKKIVHELCCVGCPASFLSPADAVHGGMGVLRPEDVLILVSKGGGTRELTPLAAQGKAIGAKLVAVTENARSVIGCAADAVLLLHTDSEPDPFNMLATASILSAIAAFDAVCICLMQIKGYKKEQFAIIHPSGAVGERLLSGKE